MKRSSCEGQLKRASVGLVDLEMDGGMESEDERRVMSKSCCRTGMVRSDKAL